MSFSEEMPPHSHGEATIYLFFPGRYDRTLLKGGSKPTVLVASASIMLHKADILPAFPAYAPILSPPIPQDLPWLGSASGWTVGESRETDLTTTSRGGGRQGKVTLRAIRKGSAFGPGDEVQLFVEIVSTGQTTIRVSSFLSTHTHTMHSF